MADINQEVKKPFEFKARTVTSDQTEVLEVDVKNVSEAEWSSFLFIEFKLPAELAAEPMRRAALAARANEEPPPNMKSLDGVVNAAEGWTVWAINDPNDHIVVIRVFNSDIDPETGQPAETKTALGAGATLKLRIPLAGGAVNTQFTLEYGYQTGSGKKTRVDNSLQLTPTRLAEWNPQVSLTCDHTSPTMLPPGRETKISWSVKDGVSATLRGPLPGGNSELTLSRERTSSYRIEEGWLTIYAVGPATYVLDAEVKGPEGQPNVQVVRTLTLDIYSADKYASLIVRPETVLPYGQVELDWAVWGVEKASLKLGIRDGINLQLTEQNLSHTYQGSGTLLVHATKDPQETVSLTFTNDPKHSANRKETIQAAVWMSLQKPAFTGRPLALAVADGNMALLTRDGLFTARVGRDDWELQSKSKLPVFAKSAATGKAWHALAAFGREFVVLRRTDGDEVVLERYDGKGQRVGLPATLPADFQTPARRSGTQFDLVSLGDRVYVVAEAPAFDRAARVAYSARFEPDLHVRPETFLASLLQYRLVSFGGALYAFQRRTGRMLRFGLTKERELDQPRKAASAVNTQGVSMIKSGLLVPVGSVLAVLDPAALPSFESLKIFGLGLHNVLGTALQKLKDERDQNEIPQDLSYNPQHDQWSACGHGLDIQVGAVAAFRGGASKRLWVLQPDGAMYTLTSANEELFARDFLDKLHLKDLPPVLDATRQLRVTNLSGLNLVPVDEVCRAGGLDPFSTDGVAELRPLPQSLAQTQYADFVISYSSTHTTEVTLRFMAERPGSTRHLLEVTLSGAGLGNINTVFKRQAADGQLDEVPGTLKTYPSNANHIAVLQAWPLLARKRLLLLNATPGELSVQPPVAGKTVGESTVVEVTNATPDFKVFIPNAERLGHLWFTFDYTKPMGVEISPRSQPQQSLIRVDTSDANMLEPSADQLTAISSIVFTFERYGGNRSGRMPQPEEVYWCRVGMKQKLELDGVRLGDAALSPDRKAIFLALARPENVSQVRVVRFDLGSLAPSEKVYETKGNVFSVPNAITVSEMYYDVMFAEHVRHTATHQFSTPWPQMFDGYDEVVALASSRGRNVFNVGKKLRRVGQEKLPDYFLSVAYLGNSREETPLNNIAFPVGVATLAVSPDGSTAAVGNYQGLLLVDMRVEVNSRKPQSVNLPSTRKPEHIIFSPDGSWVYIVHATRNLSGSGPRRVVAGRDISVSRVRVANPNEKQTLMLPNVDGNYGLTANTRQSFPINVTSKEEVALSLAVSPDNRSLFVSIGTSIMRVALDTFTLQPWRATVELPCRLICVNEAGGNALTIYALGSYYVGDGTKVDEYKTQLYFVPAPLS